MIVDLGESQPRKNGHAIPTDKEIKRETDIKKEQARESFKRDRLIRPKPDDRINKNHTTKYFLPYDQINRKPNDQIYLPLVTIL